MKKTVLTFGLISGLIISVLMGGSLLLADKIGTGHSMALGYTIMVASFLLIYFGIRSYRDNTLGGQISFGRAFAREYGFYPKACNVAAGWEKGKVERAIRYVRQSFLPLREFADLHDVNRQARHWLAEVANQRLHHETRQRPIDRFRADALRPLPVIP